MYARMVTLVTAVRRCHGAKVQIQIQIPLNLPPRATDHARLAPCGPRARAPPACPILGTSTGQTTWPSMRAPCKLSACPQWHCCSQLSFGEQLQHTRL